MSQKPFRNAALTRVVACCLGTSTLMAAAPALAAVIDYPNGSNNLSPIVLTDNSTQLQVLTGSATQSGAISQSGGSFGLEKIGPGALTFSGTNTYSGGTAVSGGTLQIAGPGTLGATSDSATISGGTLDLGGTTQTQNGGVTFTTGIIQNGTLSSSGTFRLRPVSEIENLFVNAALTGSGSVVFTGPNLPGVSAGQLNGVNTYTGGTFVNSGTLEVTGAGTLGSSAGATTIDGGTLLASNGLQTQNGGVTLISGNLYTSISSSGVFTLESGQITGILTGSGSVVKTTSGTASRFWGCVQPVTRRFLARTLNFSTAQGCSCV